jgi:AraC-like DNA-binding protein
MAASTGSPRPSKSSAETATNRSRVADIARQLGMSVSGLHSQFKAVTGMSPLQFHKQLRLQEARRLLLAGEVDVARAGYQVGYDDPSHFSREYKKVFGEPPLRDVERLQGLTASADPIGTAGKATTLPKWLVSILRLPAQLASSAPESRDARFESTHNSRNR